MTIAYIPPKTSDYVLNGVITTAIGVATYKEGPVIIGLTGFTLITVCRAVQLIKEDRKCEIKELITRYGVSIVCLYILPSIIKSLV